WEGQRPQDRVALLRERHTELLAQTGSRAVVVTLDQEGTIYFTASGREHRTWARPVTEKQASGAGDTFVAALSLACA
ncbi:PfkB family carbohydrate kinase, partial [Glutamicibacter creatinolyticus]|uniref:PfkB family carbohydrate kinase n=1 Tax=Glutamicibacter creatinolyticus TaxID=162496 RepID=UPI003B97DC69